MSDRRRSRVPKTVAVTAMALGLAGGSYGIASAATGSGSSSPPSTAAAPAPPTGQASWGPQRSDETLLTGDTATKVREAALAKVPGATIVRVETDADGHAPYEAHLVESGGTLATVYVDTSFAVVGVETR